MNESIWAVFYLKSRSLAIMGTSSHLPKVIFYNILPLNSLCSNLYKVLSKQMWFPNHYKALTFHRKKKSGAFKHRRIYLTAIVAIWLRSPHSAKNVKINDCKNKNKKIH
ncbi:hypothetical protein HanRHA438_Chr16g0759701 [Helianthus annuus]|nr:hypothetical protein HanRHA438_Chr16g0759701 [Helianthus annuus]